LEKAFSDYFSGTRTDSMMQAFSLSTSTAQIKQLAAYYASLPRKSVAPAKVKSPPKSYLGLCNGCHGLNGNSGNPNIPSLSGQNPSYLEKAMLAYRDGKRNDNAMKAAVTDLKMAMIKQLAQYYAAQTPIQVATAGVSGFNPLLEGKILASACDGCHGKNGNSELSGTPSLSGQPLTYLVNGINAYRSGKRNVPIMQAATTYLSDLDVEKISLYYSKQKPQRRSSRKMESPEQVSGCNGCHGDNGNSTSSDVPSLAGQDRHYLSKALSEYKDGKRPHDDMQNATKSLNKSQIAALAEYYSTLTRVQVENLAFEDPKSLAQKCNRCHGHIEQPDKPRIAGQIKTYLLKSLQAYKSKSRENSMMHAMSDVLSLTEMDAIASFYATKVK
ncbi:MAG: c-type cytochrome, partial [Gammaproteobacteria bacterium]|nr:c-type cytochrome [Gammaproteobacteria bacterium]